MVDEYGVLSLEIGGSSTYELSCLCSPQAVPTPEPEPSEAPESEPAKTELTTVPMDTVTPTPDEVGELTVYGIPVVHLAIFGGGLLAAIVLLIALRFSRRRRRRWDEYDEDDSELSD